MKKFVEKGRIISFIVTLLTTIPLLFNYLKNTEPKNELIVHLHVWFGLLFFTFAITSMILNKKKTG
jgi:hypothetical protein